MEFSSEYFTQSLLRYCLLQNKHNTLAENGENLISAHLEIAPTLKVQKFNKRPGWLIE